MRAGGIILSLVIVGVSLAGIRIFGTLKAGGIFSNIKTEHSLSCTKVLGVPGPEDLVIERASGVVFVSSHDRRAEMAHGGEENNVRGGIYAYDPGRSSLGFVDLTALGDGVAMPNDFRPHGLSLYTGPDGAMTLMAINHPYGDESTVEIFDVIDTADEGTGLPTLAYRETVTGSSLISPNDLVALDADRFFATNDHGSKRPRARLLEDYLRLNMASVVYYDGQDFTKVLGGLTYANGIEVDASGDRVYVAETTDNRVTSWLIDLETGGLKPEREWDLKFGVDNIDRAADGAMWIGGHPKLLDFATHAANPGALSSGRVVRIDADGDQEPTRIFQTDGEALSGLSVGAQHDGRIIMGQVFGDGLLICE